MAADDPLRLTVVFDGPQHKRLREAGSYGYLIQATIAAEALEQAASEKALVVRLEVDSSLPGGLALEAIDPLLRDRGTRHQIGTPL